MPYSCDVVQIGRASPVAFRLCIREKRAKEKDKNDEVAIVRIEQLYPFPAKQLQDIITKYKSCKEYCWVQEEPENMGAWVFMMRMFNNINLKYIGRNESASPATGYGKLHSQQQENIVNRVFEKQLVKN